MWVKSLADSEVGCGGKAHGLARLIAAGLPVPDGFVLVPAARDARDAIPAEVTAEVIARAAPLGAIVARSSATIEDRAGGTAAGVFESIVGEAAMVWQAIRAVWDSALTPLALGYARGRPIALGVVIQRRIPGERITIYTRPPDDVAGDAIWIQRGGTTTIVTRGRGEAEGGSSTSTSTSTSVALALRAERAIGAEATGADVELIDDRGTLWVVQARPIVRRDPLARRPPPPAILAPLVADGRVWRWDASHNPAPLSPAQAGLVARVERAGVAPWAMRVCGGFLYTTPRGAAPVVVAPADATELAARVAAIETRLAAALGDRAPATLAEALDRYVAHYAIWATELSPLVAAAVRAHDPARLAAQRPSRIRALLAAGLDEARLVAELGDLSPAWDVAVPTYGETWHVVRAAIARAKQLAPIGAVPIGAALERATAELAERDDTWFYRAQAMVRRALLARANQLAIDPGDVAWLELDVLEHAIDPIEATRRASAARAAHARAARWAMPLEIPERAAARTSTALHGRGIGPRVTGRVARFDALETLAITPGDVVVCQTVTPGLAVVVIGCAAIVSESLHDGLLDHGVALARELGITCVVGCRDAWSRLANGTIVTVDGAAGIVEINDKFA